MDKITLAPVSLNGLRVKRVKDTIFMPLPRELWRECHGCVCEVCKKRKATTSYFDTLAVAKNESGSDFTWMVHYPELHSV